VSVRRPRFCGDDGSAEIEIPLAVIGLILTMLLIVGGMRISNMNGDVRSAAHAGARAAAGERDLGAARAAAQRVVSASLAESGVGCPSPSVGVSGDLSGGLVRVRVTCTVSLADVALAGFPGSRTVTVEAVELTDQLRGGGS